MIRQALGLTARALRSVACGVRWLFSLVRDNTADLDANYPDRRKATGPEAAAQGSAFAGMAGTGHP